MLFITHFSPAHGRLAFGGIQTSLEPCRRTWRAAYVHQCAGEHSRSLRSGVATARVSPAHDWIGPAHALHALARTTLKEAVV